MMNWDKVPVSANDTSLSKKKLVPVSPDETTTPKPIPKISDMMKFEKGPLIVPDDSASPASLA